MEITTYRAGLHHRQQELFVPQERAIRRYLARKLGWSATGVGRRVAVNHSGGNRPYRFFGQKPLPVETLLNIHSRQTVGGESLAFMWCFVCQQRPGHTLENLREV